MKLSDLDKGLALRAAYYELYRIRAAVRQLGVAELKVGAYAIDLSPAEVRATLDARVAKVAAELTALGIELGQPAEAMTIVPGRPR